jgi:purine-binding chemotaxis protein CheW
MDQPYGVNIMDVKEIYPEVVITPIFHAPRAAKGYVNVRGQIHLVLDLRLLLGLEEKLADDDSCLVLFKPSVAEPFGILVDKIGDVVYADPGQVEKTVSSGAQSVASAEIVESVCKLEKSLLVILSAHKILAALNVDEAQ